MWLLVQGVVQKTGQRRYHRGLFGILHGGGHYTSIEHLCSLPIHVDCPKNRKSKRSALRVKM